MLTVRKAEGYTRKIRLCWATVAAHGIIFEVHALPRIDTNDVRLLGLAEVHGRGEPDPHDANDPKR